MYLAAVYVDARQSGLDRMAGWLQEESGLSEAMVFSDKGRLSTLKPHLAQALLHNCCDDLTAAAALARLPPQPMSSAVQAVTGSPRDHIASTYVARSQDLWKRSRAVDSGGNVGG